MSLPPLELLLTRADTGLPTAEGLSLPVTPAAGERPDTSLFEEGGDPNALDLQRWGLILPLGDRGDRLHDLLQPLIRHRAAEQGAPVKVFRVPSQMDARAAAAWRRQHLDTSADVASDLPRYLLVAGDLDEVSLRLQRVLATDLLVGRLAFEKDDDYAVYVDKITKPGPGGQPPTVRLQAVLDNTKATREGYRHLIRPAQPILERARARTRMGEVSLQGIRGPGELLQGAQAPGVMLSLSHGLGRPTAGWATPKDQRRLQGAPGFGLAGHLDPADVDGPFLPGGLWVSLACFGAGTPDHSDYHHWLERLHGSAPGDDQLEAVLGSLPAAGERPFVAALPKRLLALEHGPHAVIGHVDLAWTYGFRDLDQGPSSRPGRYADLLRSAARGDRFGVALRGLLRFVGIVNSELAHEADRAARAGPDPAAERRLAHLWMLRQDLQAYVLLGDPAARLPRAGPALDAVERALIAHLLAAADADHLAAQAGLALPDRDRLAQAWLAAGRSLWPDPPKVTDPSKVPATPKVEVEGLQPPPTRKPL